ncbi:hypothetical protein BDK51DRAFT_30140 [Blyttiomyces helicus]|uniref:Uncharacterized protein n=1 Tax=Blyttiomyces helicus TaxID=388810 RepID=A0A4V1IQ27_9FUNG|nr:hypothetical protein BDK51DRAFT_30140 [Blyttiomyces helicus]|eukprot:RKO85097.1 hypothetical protein BDK51DRAFT_30140 [Blyttiomyces helicus]
MLRSQILSGATAWIRAAHMGLFAQGMVQDPDWVGEGVVDVRDKAFPQYKQVVEDFTKSSRYLPTRLPLISCDHLPTHLPHLKSSRLTFVHIPQKKTKQTSNLRLPQVSSFELTIGVKPFSRIKVEDMLEKEQLKWNHPMVYALIAVRKELLQKFSELKTQRTGWIKALALWLTELEPMDEDTQSFLGDVQPLNVDDYKWRYEDLKLVV